MVNAALVDVVRTAGVRLLATSVNQLEVANGRFGLQTMCEAGGMADATVVERP